MGSVNKLEINRNLEKKSIEIRKLIIEQIYHASSGHPGSSLSCTDIITTLYFHSMRIKVNDPTWKNRDRFVLSKGHGSPALYAALAMRGFFSKKELLNFRNIDSILEGHPNMIQVPGVDMSTGSLGQGLSVALGMALSAKLDNNDYYVYVILGDGEVQEGQVWEASMAAAHYKTNNLIVFLDNNGVQSDGEVSEIMSINPIDKKFNAFGWEVLRINGHDFTEINNSILEAKRSIDKPVVIIADTVKGKGISFMENQVYWHGGKLDLKQRNEAIYELNRTLSLMEV